MSYRELRALADHGVRLDAAAVRRAQARVGSRQGARAIARLLGDGALRTRSGLERALLSLCNAAGLPRPRINATILGRERDAAWPQARLVVEVDGHAFHAPRGAREDDHERDAELVLAGWRVLRFTDTQLDADPGQIARRIAALLADDDP
jgi:very-short-patch-repair endonuclease